MLNMVVVVDIMGVLFVNVLLNLSFGRDGIIIWNGCVIVVLLGLVSGWMRWFRERLVIGKGGIKSKGIVLVWGDCVWMKWIWVGVWVGGMRMFVWNCGMELLRFVLWFCYEYCFSLKLILVRFEYLMFWSLRLIKSWWVV